MKNAKQKPTYFAPPYRANTKKLEEDVQLISQVPFLPKHFDAIPFLTFILNKYRQIVYINNAVLEAFNLKERRDLYGLRPGEALDCVNSSKSKHGCGTSSFCRECGAVKAIQAGLNGTKAVEECHIAPKGGGNPFDFCVTSSPYEVGNKKFVVFIVNDISNKKRRQVLERIFFHDITNTLGGVFGFLKLAKMKDSDQKKNKRMENIYNGVEIALSELQAQRKLLEAETGELVLKANPVFSLGFLKKIVSFYKNYDIPRARNIIIDANSVDIELITDETLLARVLLNMLKNAMEASSSNESIRVGCRKNNDDRICFWVQNHQFIPQKIRSQIFNRSFSTKGVGRGIGTYSMKLLGEQYLQGNVSFFSSHQNGTTFKINLPLAIQQYNAKINS